MRLFSKQRQDIRKGTITVLAAFMSIVLLGMVAFSVDLGYIFSAKEEMQRTADAAATAACWELGQKLSDGYSGSDASQLARLTAENYASQNCVTGKATLINTNLNNDPNGDVVFGYLANFYGSTSALDTSYPNDFNVVRVRVHKNSTLNGKVPYFFAKIFGMNGQTLQSEAMAGIVRDINGFKIPADGGNTDILPFALDLETWNDLMDGIVTDDDWRWDSVAKQVVPGSDGIYEVNLYPQGTGSPGNRGTVDIGSSNNSTSDIARQILYGISPGDFAYLGGYIEFDNGELILNGDTGISAGFKDELAAIIGKPRVIPIFSEVNGPGNTAQFTIVKWFGIRICDVKLTGPMTKKHVTIQAAPVVVDGIIPSPTTGTSDHVFSTVVLLE